MSSWAYAQARSVSKSRSCRLRFFSSANRIDDNKMKWDKQDVLSLLEILRRQCWELLKVPPLAMGDLERRPETVCSICTVFAARYQHKVNEEYAIRRTDIVDSHYTAIRTHSYARWPPEAL